MLQTNYLKTASVMEKDSNIWFNESEKVWSQFLNNRDNTLNTAQGGLSGVSLAGKLGIHPVGGLIIGGLGNYCINRHAASKVDSKLNSLYEMIYDVNRWNNANIGANVTCNFVEAGFI